MNQHRDRDSKDEMRLRGFHGSFPRQWPRGYADLSRARDYKDARNKKSNVHVTIVQEYYILPSLRALGQWDLISTKNRCQLHRSNK